MATWEGFAAQMEKASSVYELLGDRFRSEAYHQAARIALAQTGDLGDAPPAAFGKSIAAKYTEYRTTGHIGDLDDLFSRRDVVECLDAVQQMAGILGVGNILAKNWYQSGYRFSDVMAGKIKLTAVQTLGLKHYEDLHKKIPREMAARIFDRLRRWLPDVAELVGSYRRQCSLVGDLDILCVGDLETASSIRQHLGGLPVVGWVLQGDQRLTFLYQAEWVVQVDILICPVEEHGAALLYFTGDVRFNTTMRQRAKKRGFRLNQRGMFRLSDGVCVSSMWAEDRYFDALEMEYVEPSARQS